jgi:NADP-dependent alcohol dehydrogenase
LGAAAGALTCAMHFTYHNPVRIHFGEGQIARIADEIPAGMRIMVTYGGGSIKANGVYEQVQRALAGRQVIEFGGIEPNPTYETLMQAVALCRRDAVGYLLAVGGGSVLDGTKFIAAAIPFAGEPWDILAKNAPVATALPIGAVLTLPATGSEMNGAAVISRASTQEKLAFITPAVLPRFSVLDPMTTRTLPPRQVGNGIVDAFVHVCEQYLVARGDSAVQDRQAEAILLALIDVAPRALARRDDPEVLGTVMWAATNALNGLIGVGVRQDWATHMIGHELTAFAGLDHAQTLAVVLPSLLRHRRVAKRAKLVQYAERVWGLRDGTEDARIATAIDRTEAFFRSVGVGTRLADYRVDASVADRIAERFLARGTKAGEDQDIDGEAVRAIVRAAA